MRKVADNADIGLVAKSTEEVLNKIEVFNKKRLDIKPTLKRLIIASMDIEKYYPSILSAKSAKIIRMMWEESDLSIDGVDFDQLSRYLGNQLYYHSSTIQCVFFIFQFKSIVVKIGQVSLMSRGVGRHGVNLALSYYDSFFVK